MKTEIVHRVSKLLEKVEARIREWKDGAKEPMPL